MRTVLVGLIGFIALLVGLFFVWRTSITETDVVSGPTGRWVVIEYENRGCPLKPTGMGGSRVVLSSDGYACFSDPLPAGPFVRVVLDAAGRKVADASVRQQGNTDSHNGHCLLRYQRFFYGTDAQLASATSSYLDVLDPHHPECR